MLRPIQVALGVAALCLSGMAAAVDYTEGMKRGDVELKSIGPLSFGPDGVLFVADPIAAVIYAVATGDTDEGHDPGLPNISGIDAKIAAMLGTTTDGILIKDIAVNPLSGTPYLSVSRGRGPDAVPVLLTLDAKGNLGEFSLEGVSFSKAELWDAPEKDARGRDVRGDAITEIGFVEDKVIVAGLSNQEFASRLRAIPFPFTEDHGETALEIFHTSHGRWETNSPIRTFVPHVIDDEAYILAAYTCTPLVRIPVKEVQGGAKIVGTTVAELGNRNRPIDMIVYEKDGAEYLLMSNSRFGLIRVAMANLGSQESLTEPIAGTGGIPGIPVEDINDALQLERWGEEYILVLQRSESGGMDLKALPLP